MLLLSSILVNLLGYGELWTTLAFAVLSLSAGCYPGRSCWTQRQTDEQLQCTVPRKKILLCSHRLTKSRNHWTPLQTSALSPALLGQIRSISLTKSPGLPLEPVGSNRQIGVWFSLKRSWAVPYKCPLYREKNDFPSTRSDNRRFLLFPPPYSRFIRIWRKMFLHTVPASKLNCVKPGMRNLCYPQLCSSMKTLRLKNNLGYEFDLSIFSNFEDKTKVISLNSANTSITRQK